MTNLLGMLRKAVEAKGKEVSFPADEAEIAIIAAIRAVNASHEREVAENGYKNILDLHQETYKELQAAQAEARGWEKQSHSWQDRAENADCRIARMEAEARELRAEIEAARMSLCKMGL